MVQPAETAQSDLCANSESMRRRRERVSAMLQESQSETPEVFDGAPCAGIQRSRRRLLMQPEARGYKSPANRDWTMLSLRRHPTRARCRNQRPQSPPAMTRLTQASIASWPVPRSDAGAQSSSLEKGAPRIPQGRTTRSSTDYADFINQAA